MKDQTNGETKLIVSSSDIDADMLYATKFWAGDPFIFLQQNGKRAIVLTDLEMGRGKRTAKVDEFVSFNQLEREVQGNAKQAPPFEKVVAHFLR
jgi:Xaa-Pro aminopeptidase